MQNHRFIFFLVLIAFSTQLTAQNIFRTACQGNIERLDSLLQNSPIDTIDNRGRSLLHWAVACKQQISFDFLLERGIPSNLKDKEGATPLYMAVRFKNEVFFNQLIALKENQDWATNSGAALLEKAILNKDLTFVKKLIKSGVAINIKNKRGSTPLEIAKKTNTTEIASWLIQAGADPTLVRTFNLKGKYLGQKKPGKTPQVFAPNFISIEEYEFGSVFNAKGDEFYYGVDVNGKSEIRFSKRKGKKWTEPVVLLVHERYGYNDPFLSPDENRLYFISQRALDGNGPAKEDHDIWYVERTQKGWSEPINAGPNINSGGNEYYISFTKEGTMYFSSNINAPEERKQSDLDIYYSKYVDGTFQKAIRLSDAINTPAYEADVYVAPDESYLIFCSTRNTGLGRGDLYISFKNTDGTWTRAINMGDKINTEHHELCPYVTPDGKYFFSKYRTKVQYDQISSKS